MVSSKVHMSFHVLQGLQCVKLTQTKLDSGSERWAARMRNSMNNDCGKWRKRQQGCGVPANDHRQVQDICVAKCQPIAGLYAPSALYAVMRWCRGFVRLIDRRPNKTH